MSCKPTTESKKTSSNKSEQHSKPSTSEMAWAVANKTWQTTKSVTNTVTTQTGALISATGTLLNQAMQAKSGQSLDLTGKYQLQLSNPYNPLTKHLKASLSATENAKLTMQLFGQKLVCNNSFNGSVELSATTLSEVKAGKNVVVSGSYRMEFGSLAAWKLSSAPSSQNE
jgi:hypothetical protein